MSAIVIIIIAYMYVLEHYKYVQYLHTTSAKPKVELVQKARATLQLQLCHDTINMHHVG